ncbi:MAG: cytochrome c [Ignavibacteriaceae bacterium]|jgi:mono/diheme cytochrome c family protein|nr:cytochrome c [Ignavibacteriaceae bacterium]
MKILKCNCLKNIFEKPLLLYAPVFPYLVVVLILMGLLYISKLNPITENKIPLVPPDSVLYSTELSLQEPKTIKAIEFAMLKTPTSEMLDKGKELFISSCGSCHGNDGKGDGVAGVALNPKPRNFYNQDGWKNGPKVSGMYLTLQKGIPGSGMTAYDFLSANDRLAIIHFIRQEFMTNPATDTDTELQTLDKIYNLTAGTVQPGQIPIPEAENLLLQGK